MALALRALGKHVADGQPRRAARSRTRTSRASVDIEVAPSVDGEFDALFVMECGDLSRPGVAGLERYRVINIDHHLGNTQYGAVNWFDSSYAACAEMVVEIVDALGVPLSRGIAPKPSTWASSPTPARSGTPACRRARSRSAGASP